MKYKHAVVAGLVLQLRGTFVKLEFLQINKKKNRIITIITRVGRCWTSFVAPLIFGKRTKQAVVVFPHLEV